MTSADLPASPRCRSLGGWLATLTLALVVSACGGDTGPDGGGGDKPVATVTVSPSTASMEPGSTQQFTATLKDADGATLTGRAVAWKSDKPAIATVDGTSGLATAVASGSAVITATSEGKSSTAMLTVTVEIVPVASVVVNPPSASVQVGATTTFTATTKAADGATLAGRTVTWSSDHTDIASVDAASGAVTGIGAGSAVITATSEGKNGVATVTVTAVAEAHLYYSMVTTFRSSCDLDESGIAWCWGAAFQGELGTGTTEVSAFDAHVPALVIGNHQFGVLGPRGDAAVCGLAGGKTWCWGAGHVTLGSSYTSTPVAMASSLTFSSIATGSSHACALTAAGAAYCWGYNPFGELGNGSSSSSDLQPVAVLGGLTFATITAGNNFTCGVTTTAKGYCWGGNQQGQLGNGSKADANTPVEISGTEQWSTISSGEAQSCGVTTAGAAFCWGDNDLSGGEGILGVGSTAGDVAVPTAVAGGHAFRGIAVGNMAICGVTTSDEAWCWGYDSDGQLGHANTTYYSDVPLRAGGTLTFAEVSTAGHHSCGISADRRTVYCWGANVFGELGNATTLNDGQHHPDPVVVSGQTP